MAEKKPGKARRSALWRAAGARPPSPPTPPQPGSAYGVDDVVDDDDCVPNYRYNHSGVCFEDHDDDRRRRRRHDPLLFAYLQERWGVYHPERLLHEFSTRIMTLVAWELRDLPRDRFRSPSGFFISRCREVARMPEYMVDRLLEDL